MLVYRRMVCRVLFFGVLDRVRSIVWLFYRDSGKDSLVVFSMRKFGYKC